ncbi:MAG: hypothetical protein U0797_09385 [Gemmataceae bacterium]
MGPITPFWFKQRQCKAEPAGENTLKVSGPNLGEAFLQIAKNGDGWKAGLRLTADGPDVATAVAERPGEGAAWAVAFELYREHVIV